MPTFIGYNSQGQYRKFTITDFALIRQDLLNAFNIRQGELVGRPTVGCAIWNLIFENQSPEIEAAIQNEIRRIAALDPRINLTKLNVYPEQNGILVEIEFDTVTGQTAEQLAILFDQQTRRAVAV
jgi:phage baseplate assembly protein W